MIISVFEGLFYQILIIAYMPYKKNSAFLKKYYPEKRKISQLCVFRTTLCTQILKFFQQNLFFLENVFICTKFNLRLKKIKKVTCHREKNASHTSKITCRREKMLVIHFLNY